MQQLDLFRSTEVDYLYGEFQKTKGTVDKLRKSMHAHLAEIHDEIMTLKNQMENKGKK